MPQIKSDVHITPDIIFEIIEKQWGYKKDNMFDDKESKEIWDSEQEE